MDQTKEKIKSYSLPYTLDLIHPIRTFNTSGDVVQEIKAITFQNRITAKTMAKFPTGGTEYLLMEHFFPIISQMTGELMGTVEKLDYADDLQPAIEVVSSFLAGGSRTIGDSA